VKQFKGNLAPFVKREPCARRASAALLGCSQAITGFAKCEILNLFVTTKGLHTLGSIQILIVEDFEPFAMRLCSILRTLGFTDVVQARDGEQAVQLAGELQPGLILLDLGLPKLSGLDVARQVGAISPQSQILIVSSETSGEIVEAAMLAGASGYVFKYCASTDVAPAVRAVLNGEKFLSARSN